MAWLDEINDEYLRCRNLRHAWSVQQFEEVVDGPKRLMSIPRHELNQWVGRFMECEHCGVRRVDVFGRGRSIRIQYDSYHHGVIPVTPWRKLTTRYFYPKDYQFHGMPGERPSFSDYTNEGIGRALPKGIE